MLCFVCLSEIGVLKFKTPVSLVWVGLPILSTSFCIPLYLKTIVGPLGTSLYINLPTITYTRPNYTRVCVEMDLTMPRPYKF